MRRVLVVGLVVGIADGALLGAAAALGWVWVAWAALVVGLVGAVLVALSAPPPETVRPVTVTLGLPLREGPATEEEPVDAALPPADADATAPAVEAYPLPARPARAGEPSPAAA